MSGRFTPGEVTSLAPTRSRANCDRAIRARRV